MNLADFRTDKNGNPYGLKKCKYHCDYGDGEYCHYKEHDECIYNKEQDEALQINCSDNGAEHKMKNKILELLDDWWAMFWLVTGIIFIVLAIISAFNKENDKALACIGIGLACYARCEVKILQRKIEKNTHI